MDDTSVSKVVEKLIEPVVKHLEQIAGPAAEEIGLTIQDCVKVYRAKRQFKLLQKMQQFIAEAGFEPRHISLKVLLPSMDYASVEDDEDLHTVWAALLANSADPRELIPILPSFAVILRDLTIRDARFLNAVYANAKYRMGNIGAYRGITDLDYRKNEFLELYQHAGLSRHNRMTSISQKEWDYNKVNLTADFRDFTLTLEILKRHGILVEQIILPTKTELEDGSCTRSRPQLNYTYKFTEIGIAFMAACEPPEPDHKLS